MDRSQKGEALVKRNRRWRGPLLGILSCILAGALGQPAVAIADDWGCQVMLCLADPRGSETEPTCVPPIEKLWSELRKGHAFPSCDMTSSYNDLPPNVQQSIPPSVMQQMASSNSSASNTYASSGYCREDLLYWGGSEQSELLCSPAGAINVVIDGQLWTRVWWDAGSQGHTITENYGANNGPVQTPYDPTQAGKQFMQQQYSNEGGGGG
jgi:hypothetical protein